MKSELKSSVNMNLKDGQTANLTKVLYVPKAVKNILSISRLISKGITMGATQDRIIIKKNGVSMILDARKGKKNHDVLLEGEEVCHRRKICTNQSARTEKSQQ